MQHIGQQHEDESLEMQLGITHGSYDSSFEEDSISSLAGVHPTTQRM
jgi:hypothetical protein